MMKWACVSLIAACVYVFCATGRKEPCGPVMGRELCQLTSGCTHFLFNTVNLSCDVHFNNKTFTLTDDVVVQVDQGVPGPAECQADSRILLSRTKFARCVKLSERKREPDTEEELYITDVNGVKVKPGEAVSLFKRHQFGIYVGRHQVLICPKSVSRCKIRMMELKSNDQFRKVALISKKGPIKLVSLSERIARARNWVGKTFTKGGRTNLDFIFWISTQLTGKEAWEKGITFRN